MSAQSAHDKRAKIRANVATLRANRKALGLCPDCAKAKPANRAHCDDCREEMNRCNRDRRERQRTSSH